MREPPPTNVTALPTSFVGRRDALEGLEAALGRSRLVTVLGPPGTGKTRIVKEYALGVLARDDAPPGGVFFCELGDATTAFDMLSRLAQVVSIPIGDSLPIDESRRRVETALRARPAMLLILDNFEQLVRPAASLLAELLAAVPVSTRLLVTSRERLGIPGEALFDLGPLALPGEAGGHECEAVQLFLERARAAAPGTGSNASETELRDIATLVRLLDGLPLAIELAAARMRVLAPAELLERFGGRFGWLTHDPSVLPRRATLWETIESSWSLLAPWEQRALAQASAFRGGFGVAAVEGVLELDDLDRTASAIDVLQSLRDKSLLLADERDPSVRRFTLLQSIRDFAEAKLDTAATLRAHERHARHYLELGEKLCARLDVADDPDVRRKLRLEHENLLAVHRRFLPGHAALASPKDLPSELHGAALRAALVVARSAASHPYALSLEALDAALATTDEGEIDPRLVARGLEARGNLRRFVGQTRESIEDFERVLAIATKSGDRTLSASALSGLGNAATVRARWTEAGDYFERALALVKDTNDRRTEGRLLAMQAATHFNRDDPDASRALLVRALDLQRETRDRAFEGISVTSLGIVSLATGSLPEARTHLAEGLRIHREAGARHWEGVTLSYVALAEHDAGALAEAERIYDDALALLSEINVRRAEGIALAGSASVHLSEGQLGEAKKRYRRALDLARSMSPDHEGLFLGSLGAIAAIEDALTHASDLFEQAERTLAPYPRPAFACAIEVHRGLLDLARARASKGAVATELHRQARARLDGAAAWTGRSVEVRCAVRLLEAALAKLDEGVGAASRNALVVGPGGLWFKPPRAKESVRLHRRRALQRIVHCLAEHRLDSPGEAASIGRLVEQGWPGEKVLPEAGTERVYNAVATLRSLGLRKLLLQRDDGYLLDPTIEIVRATSGT